MHKQRAFDVPIDMKYTDKKQGLYINLKAGVQKLDGDKAEQVVRFRHNSDGSTYPAEYGIEDIGRMKTQRNFLKALAKQTLKIENIFKINEFTFELKSFFCFSKVSIVVLFSRINVI